MFPRSIFILGGGTAGWMAASYLAKKWQHRNIAITLLESDLHKTLGVGEGSTPFLKDFFAQLEVSESEWMPQCDATFKHGIDFPGWLAGDTNRSYFHPFYGQSDQEGALAFFGRCNMRRQGLDVKTSPDDFFISSYLAKQGKSPYLQSAYTNETFNNSTHINNANIAQLGHREYGYHFDAGKLGEFLKGYACAHGVKHVVDQVTNVSVNEDGIDSLITDKHGEFKADLFIDCSGTKGMLIQSALGEKLTDYSKYLPNNRAVAIQTAKKSGDIVSHTCSKGVEQGWMWTIPLQSRNGNGLVYCSKYMDENAAEAQLREALNEYDAPANHLRWHVGRISQHWKQNCLALGMSQGFLEPLEAPMLNMVQQTLETFVYSMERYGNTYNARHYLSSSINKLIDGTCDYLQAHYKLNTRTDSQYWRDNATRPTRNDLLSELMYAWQHNLPFDKYLAKYASDLAYGKTSWFCLFAGMDYFGPATKAADASIQEAHHHLIVKQQLTCQRFASADSKHVQGAEVAAKHSAMELNRIESVY